MPSMLWTSDCLVSPPAPCGALPGKRVSFPLTSSCLPCQSLRLSLCPDYRFDAHDLASDTKRHSGYAPKSLRIAPLRRLQQNHDKSYVPWQNMALESILEPFLTIREKMPKNIKAHGVLAAHHGRKARQAGPSAVKD